MTRILTMASLGAAISLLLIGCGGTSDSSTGDVPLYSDVASDSDMGSVDLVSDVGADEWVPPEDELPNQLAISYSRPDEGEPVSDEEVRAFTLEVLGFLQEIRYFDHILYTTHGVDASTGKRDYQFWYNEHFRKDGDLVTFYHPTALNDGGHNLHIPFSRVLGDVLAAYLLVGQPAMRLGAEQFCKGMSASMLGMVKDENDTLHHLMTRNMVTFNHEFLTHDGKRKAVDYSGWYSDYDRWNCSRFQYQNNPYWGSVWVTNMRSKDDVPHIFRLLPNLRYAVSRAKDESVRVACGETLELLEAFARDIVDSDYRIRTKDADGETFIAGFTQDEELNKEQGDLCSFINYREALPEGECNARRGAELIGYHHAINEECGRGEPNFYDEIAFQINRYNKRICRYFHLAHLANSLVNGDADAAALMDGLRERMDQEFALPVEEMQYTEADYNRELALYVAQSQAFGYPITSDEVRMIHDHYRRAIQHYRDWPYWDPWADSVPDGDLGGYRPPSCEGEDADQECWWKVEDLAQIFETCWSPYINPESRRYVDCDIVRDPSRWNEAL